VSGRKAFPLSPSLCHSHQFAPLFISSSLCLARKLANANGDNKPSKHLANASIIVSSRTPKKRNANLYGVQIASVYCVCVCIDNCCSAIGSQSASQRCAFQPTNNTITNPCYCARSLARSLTLLLTGCLARLFN